MKQISLFSLALAFILTSCGDEAITPATVTTAEISTSEEVTLYNQIDSDLEDTYDDIIETRDPGNSCAQVTFENEPGTFPNLITIDFGTECVGPLGRTKAGMLIIEQSAPMNEPGATRTVNYRNFTIDGISISGTRSRTNLSNGEEAQVVFLVTKDLTLTMPSGATAEHRSEYTREQIAGTDTDERIDDVFQITGSGSGINRNGNSYELEITNALIKAKKCRWIQDGAIALIVTKNDEDLTFIIDFGHPSGECDNLALVTLPDGTEKELRINRRWW